MDDLPERLAWFENVVVPCIGALRARLRRIVPGTIDLDDVAAETLTRAFAAENWREVRHGLAFLYKIARNHLADEARRSAVVSFDYMADLDRLGRSTTIDGALDARDQLRRLEKMIYALPRQQRRAFLLRRVHGYSVADVGAEMGLSVSTVENHLSRALASIARGMVDSDDYGGEQSGSGKSDAALDRSGSGPPGVGARGER